MFAAGGPVPQELGSDAGAKHRTHGGSLPPAKSCEGGAGEAGGGHPPLGCGWNYRECLSLPLSN